MKIMRKFWKGKWIENLNSNQIFVFGSNPSGIHGAGSAKAAIKFGALYGKGRGLQGQTYALPTKNLKSNFFEKETGILYERTGDCSISKQQIITNIEEFYNVAMQNPRKEFLVAYTFDMDFSGAILKGLNGYDSLEMLEMFLTPDTIPSNIVFHQSYLTYLKENKQDRQMNYMLEKLQATTELKENKEQEEKELFFLTKNNSTLFCGFNSEFSNFHPALIKYKDYNFISNEQFFMACKAKTFQDDEMFKKIIDLSKSELCQKFIKGEITNRQIVEDPILSEQWKKIQTTCKHFGKKVKNFNTEIWNEKKEKYMLIGLKLKFIQNEHLKIKLLNSKKYIAEASSWDNEWGLGVSFDEIYKKPLNELLKHGKNLLGKALMTIKEEFLLNLDVEKENKRNVINSNSKFKIKINK